MPLVERREACASIARRALRFSQAWNDRLRLSALRSLISVRETSLSPRRRGKTGVPAPAQKYGR